MGVYLNTADSKISAENFILALNMQIWLGKIEDNEALIENISETKSNSELAKNLLEDNLEINSFVFLNTVYFRRIVMHAMEDFFSI